MALCNERLESYIRNKHFDYLNGLSGEKRFTEKFRLMLEETGLEIRTEDKIAGWFTFDGEDCEYRLFDDEKLNGAEEKIISSPEKFASKTSVDRGHTLVDYGGIISSGLCAYEKELDEEIKKFPEDKYLVAMKETLKIVFNFTQRIAGLVYNRAQSCSGVEKKKLLSVCEMVKRLPFYPAESFTEAVQSIWIIHFLLPLAENAWYSISLGKFDEYMYPFYKKAIDGGAEKGELREILYNFYSLLNSYADGACLLNIGAQYNELSELIIECQKEFKMPAPILGARVNDDTPDCIWSMLIDESLFSMGQPTFYSEKSCIKALCERGISDIDAQRFSNNSCMGISLAAEEFNSMWGCVLCVPAIVRAAVDCGKISDMCDITVSGINAPKSLDELYKNFEKCALYLIDICVKSYEKRAQLSEKTMPDCFVSLLTDGCIKNHRDRISGANYHNVTIECMGMVNTSDGIYAIDRLVFGEKKYTLDCFINAVKCNYKGYETLKSDVEMCVKFGENSDADLFAVRLAEILQKAIRSFDHDNVHFLPSLHTLDHNVTYGELWGADFDGRYSGEPFAKNAGASNKVRSSSPTSMILSSSALPQYKFFGGQPIDVNFQPSIVKNHKNEIRTLAEVYFERGGLQFQVNSLSSDILKKAVENPDMYRDLVVRIGGFSIYFCRISRKSQEEFIERFEKEERDI